MTTTLTCEHCESEIDVAMDPRCVVYDPSGATHVSCKGCREGTYLKWAEMMSDAHANCGDLNEPFRIKRGWQA